MADLTRFERTNRIISKIRMSWWIALLTTILMVMIWFIAVRWYQSTLIAEHRSQTSTEVSLQGNALSLEINRRVSLLNGLHALTQTEEDNPGFEGRFNRFAETIYFSTPGIRSIGLAPGGILRYVYPESGNGAVLGYEPLNDRRIEIREDMERMVVSKKLVISGPADLLQGGYGLIARQPIYQNDHYWGFAEIGLDLDSSLDWGVFDTQDHPLDFALLDSRGRLIYGDDGIFSQNPVIHPVDLVDGVWQLAAVPQGGWQAPIAGSLRLFQGIGILLIGLVTLSVYLISNQQIQLTRAVAERTQEITQVNNQLREGIRERLEVDRALRSSEELLANILRVAPDAIISCSKTGNILLFNHAAEDILGYEGDEILGKNIRDIFPIDVTGWIEERELEEGQLDQLLLASRVSFSGLHKDGNIFPAEASISSFRQGADTNFIIIVRDVAERLRAEEALKISENRFRGLFEQSLFAIQLFNRDGTMTGYNQAFYDQFAGIFPNIQNYNILDDPINARLGLTPVVERALGGEIIEIPPMQLTEDVFPRIIGQPPHWIKIIMNPITDKNGEVIELAVIFEDISERMQAELLLKERELQYRSIFESVSDGLFINTLDGLLVDFNPTAAHMHGYTIEEFRSLQPPQFVHPDSFGIFEEYMQRIKLGTSFRGRAIDVKKDGSSFHVEVTGSRFIYQGKPHSLAVVRDVTEQVESYRLLEERVRERTREIYTLLEVSRNVSSTLELRPLLALILDQLNDVLDYQNAEIFIIEGREVVLLDQRGEENSGAMERYDLIPDTPIYELLKHGEPLVVSGTDSEWMLDGIGAGTAGNSTRNLEHKVQWKSMLLVPLLAKTGPIGFLKLTHNHSGYYRQGQADLAQAFASHVAVAIENARLYEQAQSLASIQERQKLARELHDSVSQALYGIALGARTARTLLDRQTASRDLIESLEEPMDYVLELADAGLAEMRALIFELRPESLESEGLVIALMKQAAAIKARYQLEVFTEFCPEPEIPLAAKETLYRISQEATHNTVKQAAASEIHLQLEIRDARLVLEIQDNGMGFEPSGEFPGHLGLRSMRERMERVGGSFLITSSPQHGTTITAQLPYPVGDR